MVVGRENLVEGRAQQVARHARRANRKDALRD